MNDIQVFKKKGLRRKLRILGKKAIGDAGYRGHQEFVMTPNGHDIHNVHKFKSRALKRHETFNGMTKEFDCLSGRFRHSVSRFKACFEAVCVLCQYSIENDRLLFDILIEQLMEDYDNKAT